MITREISKAERIINLLNDCGFDYNFIDTVTFAVVNSSIEAHPNLLGFLDLCFYSIFGKGLTLTINSKEVQVDEDKNCDYSEVVYREIVELNLPIIFDKE